MSTQDRQSQEVNPVQRLLALKALREYVFMKHPMKYNVTDIAGDIPQLSPHGHMVSDVIPSMAIISGNRQKRDAQVDDALKNVRKLEHPKNLLKDVAKNSLTMGLGSVPVSLLASTIGGMTKGKVNFKNIFKGKNPLSDLKFNGREVMDDPKQWRHFLDKTTDDVTNAVAFSTAYGATAPLFAKYNPVPHKAYDEAADILKKNPYSSSIPITDYLMSRDYKEKQKHPIKDTLTGAGLGAGAGAVSSTLPSLVTSGRKALFGNLSGAKEALKPISFKRVGKNMLLGSAIGSGIGLLTNRLSAMHRKRESNSN